MVETMPLMVTVQEGASTVAGTGLLDIVVPYTTPRLTRLALREAEELALKLPSRIRILRMLAVPFPLDLRDPPVALDVVREQTRQVARGIAAAEIVLFLTRDPEAALLKILRPGSIVVIASKKRWWRTAQERLQRTCTRHGHQVALVYSR
jgi:hypothetical protein